MRKKVVIALVLIGFAITMLFMVGNLIGCKSTIVGSTDGVTDNATKSDGIPLDDYVSALGKQYVAASKIESATKGGDVLSDDLVDALGKQYVAASAIEAKSDSDY